MSKDNELKETEVAKLIREVTSPEVEYKENNQKLDVDEEFLYNETLNLLSGLKRKEDESLEENKTRFFNALIRLKFLTCVMVFKYNVRDVVVDGLLEEATEEKISNLLGHKGLVVTYNTSVKKWQCVLNLRGGVIIFTDDTQALCALRAAIFKYTGANNYYYPLDIEETMVAYWQKANETKENPFAYSMEDAEVAASNLGTSIDEIEAKIALMNKDASKTAVH